MMQFFYCSALAPEEIKYQVQMPLHSNAVQYYSCYDAHLKFKWSVPYKNTHNDVIIIIVSNNDQ